MSIKSFFIALRNTIISWCYRAVCKPFFFLCDPEKTHDRVVRAGKALGGCTFSKKATALFFSYSHPVLEQEILGITFKNPIGLAAGFDKNAELVDILPSVGFGFAEVGSITGEECEGNPKPRLWRLKKTKSLVVYYGLKNDGAEKIAERLKNKTFYIPIGISIAKTNNKETVELKAAIRDYAKAFRAFIDIGDYFTINISCPNAFGGEPFHDAGRLDALLDALDRIETEKPVFIKLSPDLSSEEVDGILRVASVHRVHGFICSNLTKKRGGEKIIDRNVPEKGGISGAVVEDLSNNLIRYLYKRASGKYIIIGCGGVHGAESAYQKIRLGASLIQLITGMVFEGPQLISEINYGLVKLLKKDGFKNISEAVGVDNK